MELLWNIYIGPCWKFSTGTKFFLYSKACLLGTLDFQNVGIGKAVEEMYDFYNPT